LKSFGGLASGNGDGNKMSCPVILTRSFYDTQLARIHNKSAVAHSVLEVAGCVVTIDAMGCHTEVADKIIHQQADYMLAVKGNQGTLAENIAPFSDTP
jgi:hypothetical protein